MTRMGEQGERDRRGQQSERAEQQNNASLQEIRRRADEGSKQRHGENPQHRDHGDQERRAGLTVDEDADAQHLDPATPNWTAPISHSRQKSGSAGQRRDRAGFGSVDSLAPGRLRTSGPAGHLPKKWAPVVRKDRRRGVSGVHPLQAGRAGLVR